MFSSLEDETDFQQLIVFGQALEDYTATFLLSPALLVRGTVQRQGTGVAIRVEKAKTLHARDWVQANEIKPPEHWDNAITGRY